MPSISTLKAGVPATDGTNIYVFGGLSTVAERGSAHTYVLNLINGTWARKASMTWQKYGHFTVQISNEEFLLGGNSKTYLARFQCIFSHLSIVENICYKGFGGAMFTFLEFGIFFFTIFFSRICFKRCLIAKTKLSKFVNCS